MNAASTLEDLGKCCDCGNTGWAVVPHPTHCNAVEWRPTRYTESKRPIYDTVAVLCNCAVGRRFQDSQRNDSESGRAKAMTLAYYSQFVNSEWRQQKREVYGVPESTRERRAA